MKRGDVYWVNLDPTVGSEVKKRRPAMIVSPDEVNHALPVVIVAPLTSTMRAWPTRTEVVLNSRRSQVMLEQIRAVDKARLMDRIDSLDASEALTVLQKMFAT
jgi:mRNA interferase MazF